MRDIGINLDNISWSSEKYKKEYTMLSRCLFLVGKT